MYPDTCNVLGIACLLLIAVTLFSDVILSKYVESGWNML